MYKNVEIKHYAKWLEKYDWELCASLTFPEPIHMGVAIKSLHKWLSDVNTFSSDEMQFMKVTEYIGIRGGNSDFYFRMRFFLLIKDVNIQHASFYETLWYQMGGTGRLLLYDKAKGVENYLKKYIHTNLKHVDFNINDDVKVTRDQDDEMRDNKISLIKPATELSLIV